MENCPDCCAHPGQSHTDGCDVARCLECGGQRLSCSCDKAGDDVWTGLWPGEADCERLGFWCIGDGPPGKFWRQVPAGTPDASPDINRLYTAARWNKVTKRFELK